MAQSLAIARAAMNLIVGRLPAQTLSRTSYCAMVVKLTNGNRAILVAEAGRSAGGVNGPLLEYLQASLNIAVAGCAFPIQGLGTWHMNDAEQQALRIHSQQEGALAGSRIRAVVANRDICASCSHTLTTMGMVVNGADAWVP